MLESTHGASYTSLTLEMAKITTCLLRPTSLTPQSPLPLHSIAKYLHRSQFNATDPSLPLLALQNA